MLRTRWFVTKVAMAGLLAAAGTSSAALPLAGTGRGEAGPHPALSAVSILEAGTIRGGLVVHLGCRDGELTAALRANDAYVIHALAVDEESLRRVRGRVLSRGATTVCSRGRERRASRGVPFALRVPETVPTSRTIAVSTRRVP